MQKSTSYNWFWSVFNLGSILGAWEFAIDFIATNENALRYLIRDYTSLSIMQMKQAKQLKDLSEELRKLQQQINELHLSINILTDKLSDLRK